MEHNKTNSDFSTIHFSVSLEYELKEKSEVVIRNGNNKKIRFYNCETRKDSSSSEKIALFASLNVGV